MLYTVMFGAAVVAFGMDALSTRAAGCGALREASLGKRHVALAGMATAIAVVVVAPLLPAGAQPATLTRIPRFFSSMIAKQGIPAGSTVLTYPYPDNPSFPGTTVGFSYSARYQGVNDALLDQAVSGMSFRVIGGYGWIPKELTMLYEPLPPGAHVSQGAVRFRVLRSHHEARAGRAAHVEPRYLRRCVLLADIRRQHRCRAPGWPQRGDRHARSHRDYLALPTIPVASRCGSTCSIC